MGLGIIRGDPRIDVSAVQARHEPTSGSRGGGSGPCSHGSRFLTKGATPEGGSDQERIAGDSPQRLYGAQRHSEAMAKKKGRGRMSGFFKGNVDEDLGLSALAAATLLSGDFDESTSHSVLMTSLQAVFSMENFTVGEGPIEVGIAMSDYTSAEIEAVIEATQSWSGVDLIAREVARRLVRRLGIFDASKTDDVLNEGQPIKVKLNWRIPEGRTLKLWAYNHGSGALTTGSIVKANGHVNMKNIP